MPKPTFFQSVLRKPTRSYADSSYGYGGDRISPYADPQPDHVPVYAVNRYASGSDVGGGSSLAGSSRRKKKSSQAVTLSEVGTSRRPMDGGAIPFPPSSTSAFPRAKSIAKSTVVVSEAASLAQEHLQAQEKRSGRKRTSNNGEARERQGQLTPPSSVSASGSGSSTSSYRRRPKALHPTAVPTSLSRPAGWSVAPAEEDFATKEDTGKGDGVEEDEAEAEPTPSRSTTTTDEETDDSDADVFYTPNTSLSSPSVESVQVQPRTHETPPAKRFASHPAFSMNLQPPTPAPMESKSSPFAPAPKPIATVQKPVIPPKSARRPSVTNSSTVGSSSTTQPKQASPVLGPPVAESIVGEDGSDHEGHSRNPQPQPVKRLSPAHSRSNSYAMSDGSVPFAGSASGMRTRQSRNSFNDFVVHPPRRPSVISDYDNPSRPPSRAASVYSMPAAPPSIGGGGWAVARSGASTPARSQMRMPAPGSTGFEDFHVPIPSNLAAALHGPKRQSRFTPLPPRSPAPGFDRLRQAEASGSRGNLSVGSGYLRDSVTPSSASEYSQVSDHAWGIQRQSPRDMESEEESDDDWDEGDQGRPSRSYAQHEDQRTPRLGQPDHSDYHFPAVAQSERSSRPVSPTPQYLSRAMSPTPSVYSMARTSAALDAPSSLDPSALTFLPEMPIPAPVSESDMGQRKAKRASSLLSFGGVRRGSLAPSDAGEPQLERRKTKSVIGMARGKRESIDLNGKWDGSSYGEGVLLTADGTVDTSSGNYSSLILPTGAYKPSADPTKHSKRLDPRVLAHLHSRRAGPSATPSHLRGNLPSPVDFSSHHKPPGKIGDAQVLVQVYAVAVDHVDVEITADKSKGEVGKWIPGRSFVGRCITTGAEERDMVRGDLVMGLLEIRKSGALAEYLVCDRRRLARVPAGTQLSIEQIACLPLYGIPAHRSVQTQLVRGRRALILDAHHGIGALMCQLMSKAGVTITAVIPGGDHGRDVQSACMANGAKGVLIGDALTVMEGLDDNAWDFVLDSVGGRRAYEAARRILKEGGQLVSLWPLESTPSSTPYAYTRPGSFTALKAAFQRKDSKYINYSYLPPAGAGGGDVDPSGQDSRDVLEQPSFDVFRPNVDEVLPFERGAEAFVSRKGPRATYVVKIIE